MEADFLRPVPASGSSESFDILSRGRAPCASSRSGAKYLRKLPRLQTPKRQLEGSEPSDLLSRQILQADVGTGPYRRSGPQYRSRVDIPELQPAALTSVVAVRLVV